ncbi:MAG: VanW family protein [Candidatus Peregrinibacteria bacterium]|nr:VanW family protein [Candidatus Peregrinibacteria bacterium]MCB9808499.1 VanW family protein [Candidatus Peribacteria bacterium]
MDFTTKQHLRSIATLSGVLAVLTIGVSLQVPAISGTALLQHQAWSANLGTNRTYKKVATSTLSAEERVAVRLQNRLRKHGNRVTPSLSNVVEAVKQRQRILGKHIDVYFDTESDDAGEAWSVSAQRYPLWITPRFGASEASFSINEKRIAQTIETDNVITVAPPTHAVLRSVALREDENSVSRVTIDGVAKPGYMPDVDYISTAIAKTFETDLAEVTVPLNKEPGRIINMTGLELGDLSLWAEGKSNFKGSTSARQANVRKALDEHVNNTIVMPGETFSFNSTLGGSVSQANGWHMAKVIYNGGDLEYAPGGGICQASTTVYRAAVLAGFPVLKRKAHSLYVSYYKEGGVGIDATIYPGTQDLSFVNDSAHPIIIQAYHDGYDARVAIYGTPDTRTVELSGPYFTATAPADMQIATNQIVWLQKVFYPNGEERDTTISSKYKTMPQSLAREFPPEETVHASAPLARLTD